MSISDIRHEYFCGAQPGETEIRTESYDVNRYAADGVTTVSVARIDRCMECAAQAIDGVAYHRTP